MYKIIVSTHAIKRFKQRFRLKFYRNCHTDDMTRNFIESQVKNARKLIEWESSPFYVNKLATKYGEHTKIYNYSGVYYVCVVRDEKFLVVKTCVDSILFYKKG